MNLGAFLASQVVLMVNFYAQTYREADRAEIVSKPGFGSNFNLPVPHPVDDSFDFIVVGGGTAGCLVANRLARSPARFRVLLLEAGGNPPPPTAVPGNSIQWPGYDELVFRLNTVPQRFPHSNETRVLNSDVGRVLGGTSTLNSAFFNRGSPYDYNNWANISGDVSWAYANLLTHFKTLENYSGQHDPDPVQHGYSGELPITTLTYAPGADRFLRAGSELGLDDYLIDVDPNAPQRLSFTRVDVNRRRGHRASSYNAFLENQIADGGLPNLEIRRYALVDQLLFDQRVPTKVVGVAYTRHGFPYLAYASKEVILSAGAFGSPQILLRSGVGPADELADLGITSVLDLPVGRGLQEHPIVPLAFRLASAEEIYDPALNLTQESITQFLNGEGGPLSTVTALAGQAFMASSVAAGEGFPDWADLHLTMYSSDRKALPVTGDNIVYALLYLGRPKGRGSVKLNPETSVGAEPLLIDLGMLPESEPSDVDVLIEGIRMTLAVFENTTAFGGASYPRVPLEACDGPEIVYRSDGYWKCYVSHLVFPGNHPTSSCSMGRIGDPRAVVDGRLRVIGAEGLRVIDASVMPAITNANVQAPVFALAEKGVADVLISHGKLYQ